jgi:two-component system, chemotaxis family, sensor kinase CheA
MAFSLGEYQDIFLEEADEQLNELNQNLLELEKNPDDHEIINNIFRTAHSLKSSAAFVGLNELSDLAHMMENLLQGIRDGSMGVTPEIIDIIFNCFDEIRNVIDSIGAGEKPTQDFKWLIEEIQKISKRFAKSEPEAPEPVAGKKKSSPVKGVPETDLDAMQRKVVKESLEQGRSCYEVTVFIETKAQMKWVKVQLLLSNLGKIGDIVATFPSAENLNDDAMNDIFKVILLTDEHMESITKATNIDMIDRIDVRSISLSRKGGKLIMKFGDVQTLTGEAMVSDRERPEEDSAVEAEDLLAAGDEGEEMSEDEELDEELQLVAGKIAGRDYEPKDQERKKVSVLKTVKVSIDKLDLLLNNVGELVIANSGFYKLYEEMRKISEEKAVISEFKNRMEQMSRIAKDLQSGIMKTRMVPIGLVFNRFRRLVRDLTREFGKSAELIIKGDETELDKKVIDSIGEPILHLIRNAIDHGVEPAAERKRLGKSETAHITLNAYQSGNQIFVEVIDDGRGLNIERIKTTAVERGFATPEMLAAMDDYEICNIIYTPGFSTAEKVTDISGRGVGMNVVKEIVSELNGSVTIETEFGMGTRFVLAFPITLAIIPAIMVKVRSEMYAIPLTDVIETIKISQSEINVIEGHEVINLRGEILSLLRLSRFIRLESGLGPEDKMPVVVVGFGNKKIGLMVDTLEGKQEIVIKSLEQNYRTVEGFAGASILGDGSICLILDISAMLNRVIAEQDKFSKYDRKKIIESAAAKVEEIKLDLDQDLKDRASSHPVRPVTPTIESKREAAAVSDPVVLNERRTEKENLPGEAPSVKKAGITGGAVKLKQPVPEAKAAPSEALAGGESDAEIRDRISKTLNDFRSELRQSIKSTVEEGGASDHMAHAIDLTNDDLQEFRLIANMGATNAAESLSKILNKRIDLSIPEVTIKPIEQIPKYIGDIDSIYMGIMMPILGDTKGTILFIFKEDTGFEIIDLLYGTVLRKTRGLSEEGESALKELTNIVGSSVINIFGEKTGYVIRPGLPIIVHDFLQSVIDSILVYHNMANDYAIVMDAGFYFENDHIIGNLLLLMEGDALKNIVTRMRSHGGSN